jgi:hypothetical protein
MPFGCGPFRNFGWDEIRSGGDTTLECLSAVAPFSTYDEMKSHGCKAEAIQSPAMFYQNLSGSALTFTCWLFWCVGLYGGWLKKQPVETENQKNTGE